MPTRGMPSSVAAVAPSAGTGGQKITQTFDVPIDKLLTESKKWETAYDELVRGAKGTGS
jgi:hypothetical protein